MRTILLGAAAALALSGCTDAYGRVDLGGSLLLGAGLVGGAIA